MGTTKKIDWFNHFLEFIVVIIGILIAFQLNTCSVEKKQATLLESHMTNLLEETEYNKRNVEHAIETSDKLLKQIDSLSVYLKGNSDLEKINALSLQILNIGNTYYKQNAYNSLVQSGDIRFFKDFETKDDIIRLYEFYTWSQAIEKVTLDSYTNFYYPYVVENFDLTEGKAQEISVYANKKFMNIIATYRYMMISKKAKQEETLEKISTFLETYK